MFWHIEIILASLRDVYSNIPINLNFKLYLIKYDVVFSQPGAVVRPKGWAVRPLKRNMRWVQNVNSLR